MLWSTPGYAKKDEPRISTYPLDHFPDGFFYFEDSDIIIILDRKSHVVQRSEDAGVHWKKVEDIEEGHAWDVLPHPFDPSVAYVLGGENKHWVTSNQGKSWKEFETEAPLFGVPLSFHASDSDKVIVHVRECYRFFNCEEKDYVTTDGFKSLKLLRKDTRSCVFAHSTVLFGVGEDDTHEDRVVCHVLGRYSSRPKDYRLVVSDSFFKNGEETEPYLEGDRTVKGIIKMAVVKGFLVAAAKAENTDELALYVTKNAEKWHRAEFPSDHKLNEDAYTILESTNYSIQVDVMTTTAANPMGVLFTSNSNGTYFTRNIEHTNRNREGNVDFEKIQGIQGIVLVNTVSNYEEVEKSSKVEKKVQTKISFDDGRSFESIKYKEEDLHLHSVSDIANLGRIFSSPAPGLVMGVGNTGDHLKDYKDGDLYVSDDAGLTWILARKEAHKYEFGDQGALLVAVYDEGETDKISYSLNHGKDWREAVLTEKVRAKLLTTTPDSTSLKFVLLATAGEGSKLKNRFISIDFTGLHERTCEKADFEKWYARKDENENPICIMGHKQSYLRRKADAECFVNEEFKDPVANLDEICPCTDEDFECNYNFVPSNDGIKCRLSGRLPIPTGKCENPGDKFLGPSSHRLIPGNTCDRDGGIKDVDKPQEWPCDESKKPIISGEVSSEITFFRAKSFLEHYYRETTTTSKGDDQTVVMRTDEKEVYITRDHGKKWKQILKDETITAIYPHEYFNDIIYFLTGNRKVFYTVNRGGDIKNFEAPKGGPTHHDDQLRTMGFHPDSKDWLIWTGASECSGSSKGDCHDVAHISEDGGDNWRALLQYVQKCEFIKKEGRGDKEKLVYCEQYTDEKLGNPLQLISELISRDKGSAEFKTHFGDILSFATMSEFIIVAAKDNEQQLKIHTSVDGNTFADALFPPNFRVPHQRAYTVLDSSTHAIFLHVTVEDRQDFEYGSIIKSNSNGTSYVLSLNGVNRNKDGFVDFEKMLGLQGVALANVVANLEEVENGKPKKLKSMITHNDGAVWAQIPAPEKDAEGHDYDCAPKCFLHLHGYTERKDPRNTFSSPSAVGLMMGVGNVGEHLTRKSEADLFVTRDAGIEWHAVKKGNYLWEYGDQGSIIVIVEEAVATDVIYYSRDEGETWTEFKFSNSKMIIGDISSVPSDTSRNFLLWGKEAESGSKIATVNLDFTGLTDKQCKLDQKNPGDEDKDYYLWEPKHPQQKNGCLFGEIAQYIRKKPKSDCYNGRIINEKHGVAKVCECSREDFEWYVWLFRPLASKCGLADGSS